MPLSQNVTTKNNQNNTRVNSFIKLSYNTLNKVVQTSYILVIFSSCGHWPYNSSTLRKVEFDTPCYCPTLPIVYSQFDQIWRNFVRPLAKLKQSLAIFWGYIQYLSLLTYFNNFLLYGQIFIFCKWSNVESGHAVNTLFGINKHLEAEAENSPKSPICFNAEKFVRKHSHFCVP